MTAALTKSFETKMATVYLATLEEYHHMISSGALDDQRVALIKGEIVEMASKGEPRAYFISESGE